MTTIFIIAAIGAVISIIVGMLWYGDKTPMGKWHMEALGFDKLSPEEKMRLREEAKSKMGKIFLAQTLLSFVTALFIAFVTSYTVQNGGPATAVYYYMLMIWGAFTVPLVGQSILWGDVKGSLAWKRFFSDSLSNLVTLILIAFVATLFY